VSRIHYAGGMTVIISIVLGLPLAACSGGPGVEDGDAREQILPESPDGIEVAEGEAGGEGDTAGDSETIEGRLEDGDGGEEALHSCAPPADPPPGDLRGVPGRVLTRGFLYPDPGADDETLRRAAALNAMATLAFLYFPAGAPVDVPRITIIAEETSAGGLWIDYSAELPQPEAGGARPLAHYPVPAELLETYRKLLHNEIRGCPPILTPEESPEYIYDGVQDLDVYLRNEATPECFAAIPMTTASILLQDVRWPSCAEAAPLARWLEDCNLHVALFFSLLNDEDDPADSAVYDHDMAVQVLEAGTDATGILERADNPSPAPGVEWATFTGSCLRLLGVECVDLSVDVFKRRQNFALQLDPVSPFWAVAGPIYAAADIVYWFGHGFQGKAYEPLVTPLGPGYQLLVLNQCSGASNYSARFFSEKPGFDLDLVGFPAPSGAPLVGGGFVEFVLSGEPFDMGQLMALVNAEGVGVPFIHVGTLNGTCRP